MHQYDDYQCSTCGLPTGRVCVGHGGSTCQCNSPKDTEPRFGNPEHDNRPANKSHRFRPRMVKDTLYHRWLIQVHPRTIEVFNEDAEYLCQVRLVDGKMDYSQGGLPLTDLKIMFEEANE